MHPTMRGDWHGLRMMPAQRLVDAYVSQKYPALGGTAEFKAKVLAACNEPDVSIPAVALAHVP